MQCTREQFDQILQNMRITVQTVPALFDDLPLDTFVNDCRRAVAVTPFIDPTLWMRGHQRTEELAKLAEAHLAFIAALERAKAVFVPSESPASALRQAQGEGVRP